MIVKICGITTTEDALAVESAGADLIGFVFAPSKRRISAIKAAKIAESLSPNIKKVGVFVNESVENIIHIAKHVGLDIIQLHGDETKYSAEAIPYPIIKAFSIDKVNINTITNFPCDYYLIDSPSEKYRGGTGKVFNWDILNKLAIDKQKLLLAGGLSPENIAEAKSIVNPAGVDVSSGVETNGIKDHQKMKQFVENAKTNKVESLRG